MKSTVRIALLALCVWGSAPLRAQAAHSPVPKKVAEGTRIRFVETGGTWREGILARPLMLTQADTAVVNGSTSGSERIPVASMTELQILKQSSRGGHFGSGLLLGAVLGAAVAGGMGVGTTLGDGEAKGANTGGFAIAGGVVGGLIGGGIGALIGTRLRWKAIELPSP